MTNWGYIQSLSNPENFLVTSYVSGSINLANLKHYNDVIMGAMASQITSLTSFYSTFYSDADQRKHQSLCAGNSPGTGEFPAQMASNAEKVSIWWRHHGKLTSCKICLQPCPFSTDGILWVYKTVSGSLPSPIFITQNCREILWPGPYPRCLYRNKKWWSLSRLSMS